MLVSEQKYSPAVPGSHLMPWLFVWRDCIGISGLIQYPANDDGTMGRRHSDQLFSDLLGEGYIKRLKVVGDLSARINSS